MKKMLLIVCFFGLFLGGVMVLKKNKKAAKKGTYTIGILQTASHPALDAVRDGFIEELTHKLGNSVVYITQNAQGSVSQAHAIAQQFKANNECDGFLAIATPAAQALSVVEKEKPIFIAAVTDPDGLGIMQPHANVCGTKDMIDSKAEIDMLTHLLPQVKTVGLLYASGEVNSLLLVKQMRVELEKRGLIALDFAVSSESDMHAVVDVACRKADALLVPTDNMVASAINVVASAALTYKKPLLVSDNMLVSHGALASRGVDYRESGKQTAQIAYAVLVEGKKPYEMPIEQAKSDTIVMNQATMSLLGITVPEVLQKDVVFVLQNK